MKTEQNGDADETNWQRGSKLPDGKTGDDVGGVAGLRRARDFLHGAITSRGVVVGDNNNDSSHEQPDERCEIQIGGRAKNAADSDAAREKLMRGRPEKNG